MKVKATFRHVFEVTREVEVDDEDYARLARYEKVRERDTSDERLLPLWLDSQEAEYLAEVFADWRISAPLPSDFELQYTEVVESDRIESPQ